MATLPRTTRNLQLVVIGGGSRVDVLNIKAVRCCCHHGGVLVVRVAVEHRKLSALEPLAVVYDSVRVVQLPHFRNCVVGVLVNQFYQLRLAIVFQLFQQVFVRYSQEVNQ